jgi:hypothetical protein
LGKKAWSFKKKKKKEKLGALPKPPLEGPAYANWILAQLVTPPDYTILFGLILYCVSLKVLPIPIPL